MNDGYFGTKELNQATLNRITYIKEVPELCDEAIKNMLKAHIPQFAKYVDQILQVYKGIKAKAQEEDINITISPRNLENWAKIAQYEGFITAAKSTIIPVAKMDRKLEDAIMAIIQTHKWAAQEVVMLSQDDKTLLEKFQKYYHEIEEDFAQMLAIDHRVSHNP